MGLTGLEPVTVRGERSPLVWRIKRDQQCHRMGKAPQTAHMTL